MSFSIMKFLCLLFCALAAQGFAAENPKVEKKSDIPAPKITRIRNLDPFIAHVEWTSIKNVDGYKLKVWEFPKDIYKKLFQDPSNREELMNLIGTPTYEFITDKTNYRVQNLKVNTYYQLGIVAFTKTKESDISDFTTVMMMDE